MADLTPLNLADSLESVLSLLVLYSEPSCFFTLSLLVLYFLKQFQFRSLAFQFTNFVDKP